MQKQEKIDKFLAMSSEEFDKYMCETYPDQFCERNLPMSQTCMCWGFNIGKGWYSILDELCSKFDSIKKVTGIQITFQQVKEKFGEARFYCAPNASASTLDDQTKSVFCEMIYDLESKAESKTEYVCAECGQYKYEMITVGSWVYDVCNGCFRKLWPDRINGLEQYEQDQKISSDINTAILESDQSTIDAIRNILDKNDKKVNQQN